MEAAATAAADVAASFSLSGFDAANPQAFYLWEQGEDMEAMADACLIVEGTRLPVHTQVLSLACGVLRRMFADLRSAATGGAGEGSAPSHKRKADEMEQELAIEAPFAGFSVPDVALFLRLLYDSRWQSAAGATFEQLGDSLPALLRLAHQLEARQLLGALSDHLADCTKRAQLISSLVAAEECQLDELRNSCLLRLAQDLAECGSDLASALAHAALLERCGARTLAQLLGIVAAAGARPRKAREQLAGMLPSAADLEPALQAAANPGQFEWTVEAFSEKPSALGSYLESPLFKAAGQAWKLRLYPGASSKQDPRRFLAVYLACMQHTSKTVCVRHTVEVLDADGIVHKSRTTNAYDYSCGDRRGWDNFLRRRDATQHNLLAGDRLRLRVTVTLVS